MTSFKAIVSSASKTQGGFKGWNIPRLPRAYPRKLKLG